MRRSLRASIRALQTATQHCSPLARATLNLLLVSLLAFTLISMVLPTAAGSLPVLKIWEQQLQKPDRSVQRLGNIEIASVQFDGAELLTLAAPTVWDRTQLGGQMPVELRAKQVAANLNRVVEGGFIHGRKDGILTNFDPKTLQVSVASLNDVPVIMASDSFHSQPLTIVTVTYIDADYNSQPIAKLAEQWRSLIYQRLYAALMDRSPDALSLRGKLGESGVVLGGTLIASIVLWLLQQPLKSLNRRLRKQQTLLDSEVHANSANSDGLAAEPGTEHSSTKQGLIQLQSRFLTAFQSRMMLQRRREVTAFFRWLLSWGQAGVWIVGLSIAFALFPWTRQWSREILGTPTILLFIWFLTGWSNRITNFLLHLMAESWVKFGAAAAHNPQRDQLRTFSILSAVKPLKTFVIYFVGLAAALVYLGIPLSLILTVSGIVGLAGLLACQGLVKDWVMGGLLLWNDQYAVGDVISTERYTGLVERMNLHLTQLYTLEGSWVSLAHGTLTQVENLTRSWLQQDLLQESRSDGKAKRSPEPRFDSSMEATSLEPASEVSYLNGSEPITQSNQTIE